MSLRTERIPLTSVAPGQNNPEQTSPEKARANFARPIELGPDDVRAFPHAPAGFDQPRPGVAAGRVELFSYDSTVGLDSSLAVATRSSMGEMIPLAKVPSSATAVTRRPECNRDEVISGS
jgi:hypothetical protein